MKILLVDNHVLFREGIALLLRSLVADDSLYQAGTCEDALAAVAQDPNIDLVLMDINLPGASGIDAISMIPPRYYHCFPFLPSPPGHADHAGLALLAGGLGARTGIHLETQSEGT